MSLTWSDGKLNDPQEGSNGSARKDQSVGSNVIDRKEQK